MWKGCSKGWGKSDSDEEGKGKGKGCGKGWWGKGWWGKGCGEEDDKCGDVHTKWNGNEDAMGCGDDATAKGCKGGKGKGGKGKGGKGKGGHHHHGRPLVRALVRLGGMERSEARETLDAAKEGDAAAQAKIGAVVEVVEISSTSESGTSSDSSDEEHKERKMAAVKLLKLLADGDLEAFEEAKQTLKEQLGHHGLGRGKGFMPVSSELLLRRSRHRSKTF